MPQAGGDELEQLAGRIAELSQREARNARILLAEIERRRREAQEQGRKFAAPSAAHILERLRSAHSPMVGYIAWYDNTPSPGTMGVDVGVYNPDPVAQEGVYVHLFVGTAGLVADLGQALPQGSGQVLPLVDPRYPRLIEPSEPGLSVDPSTMVTVSFSLAVPPHMQASNYMANIYLFSAGDFWPCTIFESVIFIFNVT